MGDRIEIQPPKLKIALKFLALEAFLVPASIFALLAGERLLVRLAGMVGVLFFGLGGVIALCAILTRKWSFAITDDGIEVNTAKFGYRVAHIPWRDVEAVGLATVAGQTMVGVRLLSCDAFLRSRLSSGRADYGVAALIALLRATRLVGVAHAVPDAKPLDLVADGLDNTVGADLKAWDGVRNAAALLQGNREKCGYEVAFPWSDLDRPPQAVVTLIEERWRTATIAQRAA